MFFQPCFFAYIFCIICNMSVFSDANHLLNPERCWNDWLEHGSLMNVRRKYAFEGYLNPTTGKPPTISAIQKSAYTWIIQNPDRIRLAKERYMYEHKRKGIIATDDMWKEKLFNIGRLLFYQRPDRLRQFIAQHGLQKYAK